MLVASIDMGLRAYGHHAVEMVDVDVDKDTVKPGQYLFAHGLERFGEWHVSGDWEDIFIVDLRLNPIHQEIDVLKMNGCSVSKNVTF